MGSTRSTHRGGPTDHPHLRLLQDATTETDDIVRGMLHELQATPQEVREALRYIKRVERFHEIVVTLRDRGFSEKWEPFLNRKLDKIEREDAGKHGA